MPELRVEFGVLAGSLNHKKRCHMTPPNNDASRVQTVRVTAVPASGWTGLERTLGLTGLGGRAWSCLHWFSSGTGTKPVPPFALVGGNPARIIGERC